MTGMSADAEQVVSFEVPAEFDRVRADKAVHAHAGELSRTQVQKLFDAGLVWCEDEVLAKKDKVSTGDTVSFTIPPTKPLDLSPADIPLEVLFEDEDMIAINKAAGMVVHPGAGTGPDTLVHALLHHCAGQLSGIGGVERPGIVHRLDKETTGVIVAAKSDRAFQGLAAAFAERRTHKEYRALISGVPPLLSGIIEEPIGRNAVHRHKMTVREDGRHARSEWVREAAYGDAAALVRVRILTGRTHQIRVHMSHVGHPLLGDPIYGFRANTLPGIEVSRVMLHAAILKLDHPVSGEPLELTAPIPEDFRTLAEQLKR